MTELTRGGNALLTGPKLVLAVAGAKQGAIDLMAFQLDQNRQVRKR